MIDKTAYDPTRPVCPKCGNNYQVWENQITGRLTCHRIFCHNNGGLEVALAPTPEEKIEQLKKTVRFFASVIKSGESWTFTCQKALDEALQ